MGPISRHAGPGPRARPGTARIQTHMLRHLPLLLVLVLTVPLWAQSRRSKAREYDRIMAEAGRRLQAIAAGDTDPALPGDGHLVKLHDFVGRAVVLDPTRPEAYLLRGELLCDAAITHGRRLLGDRLASGLHGGDEGRKNSNQRVAHAADQGRCEKADQQWPRSESA